MALSFEELVLCPMSFKEGSLELWEEDRRVNFKQIKLRCNFSFFDFYGAFFIGIERIAAVYLIFLQVLIDIHK